VGFWRGLVFPTLRRQARKPHQGSPGLRSFSTQELVGASPSGFKSPLPHHSTRSPFNSTARSLIAGLASMLVEWCVLGERSGSKGASGRRGRDPDPLDVLRGPEVRLARFVPE
jgi:hypothetical protein